MEIAPLDRRGFLRLCVVAAGSAVAAACQKAPATLNPENAALSPTPQPGTKISLSGSDRDAWAWSKTVKIAAGEADGCQDVVLYVNGREMATQAKAGGLTAEARLSEGSNLIVAACKQPDGGEVKSNMLSYTERLRQVPTAVIQIALQGEKIVVDGGQSQPAEGEGNAIIDHIWSARPGNPAPLMVPGAGGQPDQPFSGEISTQTLVLLPPATDGEYYLQLRVKDSSGREDRAGIYFVVEQGAARIPDYDHENPAWVETAVVYGIVPGKFGQPAFRAIAKRFDDMADLGIKAIWMAPVNVSPPGDYGYAVVDYFNLNPAYGSKEDFHRMVQEAHARGIRVLMDFVPNHSSAQHPYFLAAKAEGPGSAYWDFYDRDETGEPTHYFDWTHLPNLNYSNPEVERMMIEAFSYWVREFDVDGFRVDACWGVKQRKPDFWPVWRKELKRIKPDLLLLAEAGARDPYYVDNGFDAAYDWTDELGHWAWKAVWDTYHYRMLAYNLTAALTNRPNGFHADTLIFRFLNNNDTGERFITTHGEGVARVATALLLTLPGLPCIYTGDELGEEFKPYEDSGPLAWIERVPGLRAYHKQLIALRAAHPSLHSRQWQALELEAGPEQVAYGYLRYHGEHEQPLLVLLNFKEEPDELVFSLPEGFSALAGSNLKDLLTGEAVPVTQSGGKSTVSMPGYGVRILAAA